MRTTRTLGAAALLAMGVVVAAGTAHAEPGAYGAADNSYYQMLTTATDPITVTNFPLLIAQGQEACNRLATIGASEIDVVAALAVEGPYSRGTASQIVAAAGIAYCWHDLDRAMGVDSARVVHPAFSDGD
jgi:hypothetical protein